MTNRLAQAGWFVGTIAASAAVLYVFGPVWLVGSILFVIVTHELGHYLVARFMGADAHLPFFIPAGPYIAGMTYAPGEVEGTKPIIAVAGPVLGFAAAGLITAYFVATNFPIGIAVGLALMFTELMSGTVGKDGEMYRGPWKLNSIEDLTETELGVLL